MKNIIKLFIYKIVFLIKELIKTISKKDNSYFSRKKIENLILFINANIIIIVYFYINKEKLSTYDVIFLYSVIMIYAGWQNIQLFNIKKYYKDLEKNSENNSENLDKNENNLDK